MINIERIECGNGNCFLISQNDSSILIDTAREKNRDSILIACKDKNIKLIVLTHGHIDHIQNAAYLSEKLNVPIAIHQNDCELIKDNLSEPLFAHTVLGKLVLKLTYKSFDKEKVQPFKTDIMLKDGDSLDKWGVDASVIALPGHTKGSIGILVNDSDIFVGDALMNIFFPTRSMLYGNRSIMEQSVQKIRNTGAKTLHFGHGKSVSSEKFKW